MKACIITVYNSENCGSYWQAYALKTYLTSQGYSVYFLKRNNKNASHSLKSLCKRLYYSLCKKQFRRMIGIIKQYAIFEKATKAFDIVEECDETFDLCVLGSDTIWNLDVKYFADEREIYWGNKSKAKKTISYAATLANTEAEKVSSYPELREYLESLDAIGVRDDHTKDVLSKFTNKNITVVCDPTLLYDQHFYRKFCHTQKISDYIFIYYFRQMPEAIERGVRDFANREKLKIVVMGNSMKGDEQYFAFSPHDFIECFINAKFVVTNTFHGTIFSIIFEKQALFNSEGKNKVKDLLEKLGLLYRDYPNIENIEKCFSLDCIDYGTVNKKVQGFRCLSSNFIIQKNQG